MKSLVIYKSVHHGNTEKVACEIAKVLNGEYLELKNGISEDLEKYDILGFGSGIFYGKFQKDVLRFIDGLPQFHDKRAFVFSTSGQGSISYNDSLKEKLEQHGFQIVGSFACKGFDTFGPFKLIGGISKGRPNNDDLENAREFAEGILKKM